MKDYYKILGLKETASAEEIRVRWIELMQKFHPDHGIPGEMDEEKAKEINEAYQVLKHSSSRMEYDFERGQEKSLRKFAFRKLTLPISGLACVLVLSLLFFRRPQGPESVILKHSSPPSSQDGGATLPPYEAAPPEIPNQRQSRAETVGKTEKPGLQPMGQERRTAPVVSKKNIEPPLQIVPSEGSAPPPPLPRSKEVKHPTTMDHQRLRKPSETPEKISVGFPIPEPKPPVKLEEQVLEAKPTAPVATEEEIRRFFDHYVGCYTEMDIDGFLSLFSSKAVQNKKDALDGIRRIYANFFNQSQAVQYRMEGTKIEVYENAVQVRSRYELDQISKKEGEKKTWRGQICWILAKEDGVLKIVSLDYQHQSPP